MNTSNFSKELQKKINAVFSGIVSGYLSQGMFLDAEHSCNSTGGLLVLDYNEKTAYRILCVTKRSAKKRECFIKVLRTSDEDAFYSIIDDRWELVKLELCASEDVKYGHAPEEDTL